ncbi:outer membrane protein assembly factor BamA [Desulfonatronovibrio hydrogenovorans]|uniref:outer membrane protein assembly factor BamA n=1 Tax=Desulfonatronovibrio hydrogenovorans TaxID=53245 RepID=UPI0005581D38|nr:outer membrane protein assembly factor BamA [Desulfonatronovibrio hydrogenovorans]
MLSTTRLLPSLFFFFLVWGLWAVSFASPAISAQKTAVLPFEINAPEDLAYLDTGLPTMLINSLRDKGLEVNDLERVKNVITREEIEYLDVSTSRRLALMLDSRYAVYGSFSQVEEYISLDVRLVDGFGEKETVPFYIVKEGVINILPAVEELAQRIYNELLQEDRIASINIQGINILDPDVVLLRLGMQEGDIFEPEMLNQELRRIFDLGYFDDVHLEVSDTPQGKEVTIIVDEKPLIQNINIQGADKVKEKDIREALTTRTGTVVNPRIISEDLGRIRELYRGKGYYNATVDYNVTSIDDRTANLNVRIEEGNRLFVRGIEIQGAESISQRQLRKEMALKRRGMFSWLTGRGILREELLDRDAAAIEAHYANQGFIDARVGQPVVNYEEDGIYLVFHVEEGPRYKAGTVDFRGDLLVSVEELLEVTRVDDLGREGKYFDRSAMHGDIQNLADFYTDFGYAFAEADVDMDVDTENRVVNVTYILDKSDKIYIRRVRIEGNDKTRDNVIRREMRLSDGDLFSGTALRRSNERLNRLDYFETVEIEPVPTESDEELDLVVRVAEQPTGILSAGAGYSSYDRVFFTGMIQQRNLFGKGYSLGFSGSFGRRTTSYDLSFWNPYFRDSNLGLGGDLYWIDDEYFTYDKKTRGGRVRFSYPLGEYTNLYWHYRLDKSTIDNLSRNVHRDIRELKGDRWASSVYVAASRDTTDRRMNPSRGTINTLSVEHAGGIIGGDDNFVKYIYKSDYYRPLFWRTVFHWRGQAGYIMKNTSEKIPNYELFALGGINSVRGYSARKIAPRYEDNEVKGGDKHFFTNFELIFPLNEDIGLMGLVFFDAGEVWDVGERVDFDLYKSVGTGIRWYSPLGPIRVEYGYGLDRLDGKRHSRVEFSVGQIF